MDINILIIILMLGGMGYYVYRKRIQKKRQIGSRESVEEVSTSPTEEVGDRQFHARFIYEKVGKKQPPIWLCPEIFSSEEDFNAWWDRNPRVQKGVKNIELAEF